MSGDSTPEALAVDHVDHQILHALLIDGRAPFRRIAAVIGVSEQTVARRYRRLARAGAVNIVGVARDTRRTRPWMVRMRCRLGAASAVAEALARRPDVAWVNLMAGGTEITCRINVALGGGGDDLLLERLPRTREVIDLSAHAVLHRFEDRSRPDWDPFPDPLSAAQQDALRPRTVTPDAAGVRDDDLPLFEALASDGRLRVSELAGVTRWSPARVSRRIDALRTLGALDIEVDILPDLFGMRGSALLWVTVQPSAVEAVGRAMTAMPQIPFVSAISGSRNMLCSVLTVDYEELYELVTDEVGTLAGVMNVEVSPTMRRFKQEGTRVSGARLRR